MDHIKRGEALFQEGDPFQALMAFKEAEKRLKQANDLAALSELQDKIQEIYSQARPFASNRDYLDAEVRHIYLLLQIWFDEDDDEGRDLGPSLLSQLAVGQKEVEASVYKAAPLDFSATQSALRDEARVLRRWIDMRLIASLKTASFEIPLASLTQLFRLNDMDWQILLVLLAPVLDPQLLRLYRKAWKDFTRRQADVWFVSRLLARTEKERQLLMTRFLPESPLVQFGLLTFSAQEMEELLPFRHLHLAPSVASRLLSYFELDALISGKAELLTYQDAANFQYLPYAAQDKLSETMANSLSLASSKPETLVISGPKGSGRKTAIQRAAYQVRKQVLRVSFHPKSESQIEETIMASLRDARLYNALLVLEVLDSHSLEKQEWARLAHAISGELRRSKQPLVLLTEELPAGFNQWLENVLLLKILSPTLQEQMGFWHAFLEKEGLEKPPTSLLKEIGCRQGLTLTGIQNSIRAMKAQRGDAKEKLNYSRFSSIVQAQLHDELSSLATHLGTSLSWTDIILPQDTIARLMDIVSYFRYQDTVFSDWEFGKKYHKSQGLIALFSGPSGTGKSTLAALLAREIGVNIYQVDLSQLTSKWIGETEKNLSRIFDEAERIGAALLFDEADSVFGKRTTQTSSSDRDANMSTNYLLQRVETAKGLIILTTNYRENMDDAFMRRIMFDIPFPFPDSKDRVDLWKAFFPSESVLSDGVSFESLAEHFELSGGRIRNAVLGAAFRAAERGDKIGQDDLIEAANREYRAMGRIVRQVNK